MHRVQESDGSFFENLGTLLAEKVRAQEQAEGPLPQKKDETQEEEDSLNEEDNIDELTEALLDDSDRDENELARNFLTESMGLNPKSHCQSQLHLATITTSGH
ncbi:hypothetical protein EAG_08113 [Camponotus floridanus]|uniref:Uncharacterized protein n=1 Tax=Camponotus floridanus TaxID=104421 RepID=E2AEY3_CAMFO|nr:hypothetical protein EAG_08113 [Camponotus floridanus]